MTNSFKNLRNINLNVIASNVICPPEGLHINSSLVIVEGLTVLWFISLIMHEMILILPAMSFKFQYGKKKCIYNPKENKIIKVIKYNVI